MVSEDKGEEKHGCSRVRPREFSRVLGLAWLAACVRTRNQSKGELCSASKRRAPSCIGKAAQKTMCCSSGEAEHQRNLMGSIKGVCRACMGCSRVLRDEG
jgi:hypothetical protein